jgi:hypothetical protein
VRIGEKYFGLNEQQSKNMAARSKYPFPVFRAVGQKSEWIIDASDKAGYRVIW